MRVPAAVLLLVAPVLSVAGPAAAQGPPPTTDASRQPPATIVAEPVAVMIAGCDADGDARTTRTELAACVARGFARVEGAGGGSIGYIGYSDWALVWLGDRNALPSPFTVDSDGDNRITLAELQGELATLFARFDRDRDGVATRAELLTIRAVAGGERGDFSRRRGKRGGGAGPEPR